MNEQIGLTVIDEMEHQFAKERVLPSKPGTGVVIGIVDIETLKHTNSELIKTLEEVQEIQENGRAGRRAAEAELVKIEDELRTKLLKLKENSPANN